MADVYPALVQELGAVEFVGYDAESAQSAVVALVSNAQRVDSLGEGSAGEVITRATPFYPEQGGQVGDRGVIEVDGGTIRYAGKEITNLRPWAVTKLGIGRTFQVTRELGDMTVLENLAVAGVPNSIKALFGGRIDKDEHDQAMEVLSFLGIEKLANESLNRLSYGQRKLLELASVMMIEPDMILLDEPAGGVNPALLDRILDRIQAINDTGITFLIVEHNMDVVMRLSHSIVVMAHGQVLTQDNPEAVRNDKRVLDAYLGEA